jgi:hypothetical protein
VSRARGRHVLRRADREPLEAVIDVVGRYRRSDGKPVGPVALIVAIIVGRAGAVVGGDVSGTVVYQRAHVRFICQARELVAGRRIGVGPSWLGKPFSGTRQRRVRVPGIPFAETQRRAPLTRDNSIRRE